MTLIVGIIARDAIVMGSDSQLTSGNQKEINREKMTCIPFANRSVLVAESGIASLSRQAVDFLRHKSINVRVKDEETVPNLVMEAVRLVRNHQMSLYPRQDYHPEEWKKFFIEQANFELTVAFYDHQAMPQLFSIDVSECVCRKPTSFFTASGCGADLGQYILSEHCNAATPEDLAVAIAIYAIENAIKHNPYCGRPVRIGVVSRPGPSPAEVLLAKDTPPVLLDYNSFPGRTTIFGEPESAELADIILKAEQETKQERNKKLLDIISERSAKKWERLLAEFGAAPSVEGLPKFE